MRKILNIFIASIAIFLIGCTSAPTVMPVAKLVANLEVTNHKLATVEIVNYSYMPWVGAMYTRGYNGAVVKVTNLTDSVIEIDWNSSSMDNSSVFLDGQRFDDAGRMSIPKNVIPGKRNITRTVYPSSKIFYHQGMKKHVINKMDFPTLLVVKIKQGNIEEDFIIDLEIPSTK